MIRRLIPALTVLLAVLALVPVASAAEFPIPVRSCAAGVPEPPVDNERWHPEPTPDFNLEDDCPNGLRITSPEEIRPNQVASWAYEGARSGVTLDRFQFRLQGADDDSGVEFFWNCDGCRGPRPVAELPAPDADGLITIEVEDAGAARFEFFASCAAHWCGQIDPVVLSDFRFWVSDPDPASVGGALGGKAISLQEFGFWTNDQVLDLAAGADDDLGSGVASASLELNGPDGPVSAWSATSTCLEVPGPDPEDPPEEALLGKLSSTGLCPTSLSLTDELVDLRALPDGIYDTRLTALDALQQGDTVSGLSFGIDRGRPASPTGFRVGGEFGSSRWTRTPSVSALWDDPPEQAEETAPLARAQWQLNRPGGSAQASGVTDPEAPWVSGVNLPSEGTWELAASFVDEAGNSSDRSYETFGFDDDAPPPPQLTETEWISRGQMISGFEQEWEPAEVPAVVESGVCGFALSADSIPEGSPPPRFDAGADATSLRLPVLAAGIHFVHVRSVSCARVGSATATTALKVDAEAPRPVVDGLPGGGWSQAAVELLIRAEDGDGNGGAGSGVASVTHRLDNGPTVTSPADEVPLTVGSGKQHVLAVSARDAVGNESGVETFVFSVDTVKPTIHLHARSSDDPRRLEADLADADSGIATATLDVLDGGAWKQLATPEVPVQAGIDTQNVRFSIPDENLALGDYQFRLRVQDVAGNVESEMLASIRIPMRAPTQMNIGLADVVSRCRTSAGRSCKSVSRCPRGERCRMVEVALTRSAARSVIRPYGAKTALTGQVIGSDGLPLARSPVTVSTTELFSAADSRFTAITDADGRFESRVPNGAGREFVVAYGGDSARLPVRATARLTVRAGVNLTVNSTTAHGGDVTTIRGRLRGASGRVPSGGKRLRLQFLSDDGWLTFGRPFDTDDDGKFRVSLRPWPRNGARSTVMIRVHAEAEHAWPFAEGSSKPVKIRLLP